MGHDRLTPPRSARRTASQAALGRAPGLDTPCNRGMTVRLATQRRSTRSARTDDGAVTGNLPCKSAS